MMFVAEVPADVVNERGHPQEPEMGGGEIVKRSGDFRQRGGETGHTAFVADATQVGQHPVA